MSANSSFSFKKHPVISTVNHTKKNIQTVTSHLLQSETISQIKNLYHILYA